MPNRYVVLDQNKLREKAAPEVVKLLKNFPDVHFVLPDVAFIEMTKNPASREETLVGSLKLLAEYPARVHISKNIAESLKLELEFHAAETRHLLNKEARTFVWNILHAIRNDQADRADLGRVITDTEDHHGAIAKDYLDHKFNKRRVAELIESMKSALTVDYIKSLRANRISREDRLNTIHFLAPRLLCNILHSDYHLSREKAWMLSKKKPMLLRYFYSKMWLCIDWIKNGGFECVAEDKVTNDLMDHEYILTATCFNNLLSAEERVKEAYEDMCLLLSKPVR